MNHSPVVPAPWTPLEIAAQAGAVAVDVQGRTYTFGAQAALPTSIVTKGVEILAAPVRLVGTLGGEKIVWEEPYIATLQSDAASAVINGAMGAMGIYVSNSVKVEYDGAIRFDMAITPWLHEFRKQKGEPEHAQGLQELWLEIPLRAECATLFTWWPIDFGGVVAATAPLNSGALPPGGMTLPFKPFLWLGWEDAGLSWFCESNNGWQPHDANRAIEVLREGDVVTLRLRLLDSVPQSWKDRTHGWYKACAPVTISWGLQATPVKPLVEDALAHRIVHFNHYEAMPSSRVEIEKYENTTQTVLERALEAGANVVVLHEQWNNVQNYWVCDKADEIKATVAACHARGVKILPYFGYELSTLAPEWAQTHDEVLIKNGDGSFRGGWERLPPQRDYMVCYASQWREKWLAGIAWMMDEYGFDGVYLDGTSTPSSCANARHGCGYEHESGERGETYPIWAVREMFQRLYGIVAARDGIITTHQSSCCVTPTLAYSHTYWDGEHISGVAHDESGNFELAVFRAEFMGRPFGIQAEFLSGQPEAPAYALIHNVLVRPGVGGTLDFVAPIWKAMTQFGTPQARWIPYWDNPLAQADAPHVFVSAYVRESRILLAIANLARDEAANTVISLSPQTVGHADYHAARDAVSDEPLAVENNRVTVSCAPMTWRLIEIS